MLHILFLSPYVPHIGFHGGAGRMFNLIIRLSKKYNISVLSYFARDEEKRYIPELKKYCQTVKVIPLNKGASLFNFSHRRPFYKCYSEQMKKELLSMLNQEDFDILQIEYSEMAQYIFFTPQIPVVLTIYELVSRRFFDFFRYERNLFKRLILLLKYIFYSNFEKCIYKKFDAVMTVTETDKRELNTFCNNANTFVVPTGVDVSYFKAETAQEEPNSLLYVGYFGHPPNVDAMLYFCKDILPLIKKEVPKIKLYIVGSFPTSKILSLANENIFVTGRVEDIRPYYNKTQVFIAPIRIGGGIRGKILEAWAMQKPVISTSLAANSVEAADGKDIFVANTEEDFAEKVILLLRDEELRRKLGFEGRKTVEEKFNWDKIADNLGNLYQDLAKRKKR